MENNKLLILITTYSRGENLPAVVESVVNQTFKNYKILICDDCSPNNPADIVQKIIKKYPEADIDYYRNPVNVGEFVNINIALGKEFHNGFKYLVLLQDDTVYLNNNFLEIGIQLLEKAPDATYFASCFIRADKSSNLLNTQTKSHFFLINGIDFWRNWGTVTTHWAVCIFKFNDIIKYRFGDFPRKDVINGDSLLLLRMAMKSYVIFYNKVVSDIAFNKTGQGYERFYSDPVDRFEKVEKYYKLAAESAIEHGVSKEEADNWLLNHQLSLALNALNRIGNNTELRENFMSSLMDYDKRLAISLLNTMLNSMIR